MTHCYDIGDAAAAYQLIDKQADPYLAVQLTYPKPDAEAPALPRRMVSLAGIRQLDIRQLALARFTSGHDRARCPGTPPAARQRAYREPAVRQPGACQLACPASRRLRARLPARRPGSAGSAPGHSRPGR